RSYQIAVPSQPGRVSEAELGALVPGVVGIICGDDPITSAVLDRADSLRVICKWGTGIDGIDTAAAAARHIQVLNTPGALAEPVADSVLAYILAFARNVRDLDQVVRAGDWKDVGGWALCERSLGVIGGGHVGQAVLRR